MRIIALICFLLSLLWTESFSHGKDGSKISHVEVVVHAECVGCVESKIQTYYAFSGLRVTIDCKTEKEGRLTTKGTGELDKEGKSSINIPSNLVKEDGTLTQECYAQLHSASNAPCPIHDNLESSKLILTSNSGEKGVLGIQEKLKFWPGICTSAFLWPFPKLPLPHLGFGHPIFFPPKFLSPFFPHLKKPCPPVAFPPPVPTQYPPPAPVYKEPPVPPKVLPPPIPVYPKPPVPVYKPPSVPRPIPVYKSNLPQFPPHP